MPLPWAQRHAGKVSGFITLGWLASSLFLALLTGMSSASGSCRAFKLLTHLPKGRADISMSPFVTSGGCHCCPHSMVMNNRSVWRWLGLHWDSCLFYEPLETSSRPSFPGGHLMSSPRVTGHPDPHHQAHQKLHSPCVIVSNCGSPTQHALAPLSANE